MDFVTSDPEVLKQQGTRNSDVAPWESYNAQFNEEIAPELQKQIDEYAGNLYAETSNQNKEELARQKEMSDEVAKEYQWLHPSEYADEGPRIGRIIHSSVLLNKLRKECGLNCFYRQHPQVGKITLLVKRDTPELEVGCWVQNGFMPEFTIMGFDDHGVPLAERYRGWRTCLLQLILKGFITEKLAHRVFGPATGPASERYNLTLSEFRNRKVKVIGGKNG
jgi:hypothetical protein